MADIIYTYKNQVYANITNKCNCACTFCIRSERDQVGEAKNLWHTTEPTIEEIKAAIDAFDFTGYKEFVFCGYGEPTCALEKLLETARYVKEKYGLPIRVNTNGLGNRHHGRNIVPELAEVVDSISISMNAPDETSYNNVTRPQYEFAYYAMLNFAKECSKLIFNTQFTVVDVLSQDDIARCQMVADEYGVYLKVRKFA